MKISYLSNFNRTKVIIMIVLALTKMIIVHVLVIIDDTDIFYYLKLHFKVHVYCLEKDNNNKKVDHS